MEDRNKLFMNHEEANYFISCVHLQMVREDQQLYGKNLTEPAHVIDMVAPLLAGADREKCIVISLSTSLEPIAVEVVATGGTDYCLVDLKSILKHCLLANASQIIMIHNHPSGNVEPSDEDHAVTKKVADACALMDTRLLEHIIYGNETTYYSFKEHNKL